MKQSKQKTITQDGKTYKSVSGKNCHECDLFGKDCKEVVCTSGEGKNKAYLIYKEEGK